MRKTITFTVIVLLPLIFALSLPLFFRFDIFREPQQLVSIIAMIILPFLEGIMVVASSSIKAINRTSYRIFMPWLAIFIFFAVANLLKQDECACWLIGLPLYLIFSSIGGLVAGYISLSKLQTGIQPDDQVK